MLYQLSYKVNWIGIHKCDTLTAFMVNVVKPHIFVVTELYLTIVLWFVLSEGLLILSVQFISYSEAVLHNKRLDQVLLQMRVLL